MALDPSAAIQTTEQALRQLMAVIYSEAYGPSWLEKVTTDDQRTEWAKRRTEEEQSRKGVAEVAPVGLAYSNFYDLLEIARKYWEPLKPALGRRARTLPLLDEAEAVARTQDELHALEAVEAARSRALLEEMKSMRNTVAHGRTLYPYEVDLLSGIAGRIRNQVTIFMSSIDDAGDIYPRIESAYDSLGHEIEITSARGELAGYLTTQTIVYPGQELEFTLTGWDPQDRDLEWFLDIDREAVVRSKSSEPATLRYVVQKGDVRESWYVSVYMQTADSPYHRDGATDQRVFWGYRVRPIL